VRLLADYLEVYDDEHDEIVSIQVTKSYGRVIALIDPFEIFFVNGVPTDSERAELENSLANVIAAING